jgi:hypothetical protein
MDSASKRNKKPSAKAQEVAEAQQEASCDGEEGSESEVGHHTASKTPKAPSKVALRWDDQRKLAFLREVGQYTCFFHVFPLRAQYLCNQVLLQTPFLVKHGQGIESWNKLVAVINTHPLFAPQISALKARQKFNDFVKEFRDRQREKKASTGTDDEDVTELDSLMHDLVDLKDDDEAKRKSEKAGNEEKEKALDSAGEELRKKAMGELKSRRESKEPKSSTVTDCVVDFLGSRKEQRVQELAIEKRKLDLQEKEFAFKQLEFAKRAKFEEEEREERRMMLKLLLENNKR